MTFVLFVSERIKVNYSNYSIVEIALLILWLAIEIMKFKREMCLLDHNEGEINS